MTTLTKPTPPDSNSAYLRHWVPVQLQESDGSGQPWVNLPSGWAKITSIRNQWHLEGFSSGDLPVIRMHFRALVQGHGLLFLAQELCSGAWFRQVTLAPESVVQNPP